MYGVYRDKRTFFLKALAHYREQNMAQMRELESRDISPLEKLEIFRDSLFNDNASCRGCLMVNSALEFGTEDEQITREVELMFAESEQILERIISRGQKQRLITTRFSSKELAVYLNNAISGAKILEKSGASAKQIEAVGEEFPIVLRLSQWKSSDYTAKLAGTPELLDQFLAPLVEAGVDIFHCSTRRFWEPEFEGSNLNFAGWTKKLTGKPTITVGSVGLNEDFMSLFTEGRGASNVGLEQLMQKLEREEFDMVAIGRALLVDPAWAAKIRDGRTDELIPFAKEALATLN